MGLGTYIIRRLLLVIPTVLGVSILIFAVIMLFTPEQRAALYISSPQQLKDIQSIIKMYGLDDPPHIQYFRWITQILQGNLGFSKTSNKPVLQTIIERLPRTAEIVLPSIPLIIFFGVYLGVKSAVHRDKPLDHATRIFAIFGWSLPTFWLAIMLLFIFYSRLGWFAPGTGGVPLGSSAKIVVTSPGWVTYTGFYTIDGILNGKLWITIDALRHIALPTISLTIINIALLIRVTRSSMLETLGKSYITTARAKGLKNKEVINKHARRNALIPVATLSGMLAAGLLTGVVITETVYGIDGLGRWAAQAAGTVGSPDISAVLGFAMFSCLVYVIANLVVDIIYAYLDPRIRLG